MKGWIIILTLISWSGSFVCYGQEKPISKQTRAINLFVINDVENVETNQSINYTLTDIKSSHSGEVENIVVLQINGSDPKVALTNICSAWHDAVQNQIGRPDLVLDTTRSGFSGEIVRIFTAAVGVPTFSAQFGEREDLTHWNNLPKDREKYLVQVKPPADLIPNVIRLLIMQANISDAAIIFDDNFSMDTKYKTLLANVLKRYVIVKAQSLKDDILEQLKQLRKLDFLNFFILGKIDTIIKQINTAMDNNFAAEFHNWYSFSLNNENIGNLNSVQSNPKLPLMLFQPKVTDKERDQIKVLMNNTKFKEVHIMSAFYYDFIRIGIKAMRLAVKENLWPTEPEYITCEEFNGTNTPVRNLDLLSKLKEVTSNSDFKATFADFQWGNANGDHQAKFDMDINYLSNDKTNHMLTSKLIGSWSAGIDSKIEFQNNSIEEIKTHQVSMNYRIVVVINPPFVQYDNSSKTWSGYCIDMLNEIQKIMNFSYTLYAVPDGKYGTLTDGQWNGMVAELMNKSADIALGSFSIMAERDSVIDFTIPFYKHVGISILMMKPKVKTSLFKFLTVLEKNVWLCILASYFFTSILMWIFDKYSPYSYQNNKEKYKDDDEKRIFDLKECLWFCMTSLTPQGGGEAPKNLSGRLVAATWWLFGFIIIASYTANLAAFLTVSRLETPIESLDGLSKQYKIQYAPTKDSEAYTYFERMANIEHKFYEIWKDMSLNDSLSEVERAKLAVWDYPVSDKYTKMFEAMQEAKCPATRDEALDRVRGLSSEQTSEFAWIGDAAEIRYLTMTSCDIIMVGDEFSKKPYGLGVQNGSPLRTQLNDAIIQIKRKQILDHLEDKWWNKNPNKKICPKILDQSDGISIENIGGVFIVIFVGIVLACITLSIEYWFYVIKRMRVNRKSMMKPKIAWRNVDSRRFNTIKPSDLMIKPVDSNCRARF
ncbi:ionotropic receptor 25a-like isoform X2 [Chelonus insularis]|uniref:ionotropic receptor 25a-like isoform X2 n=1 Tax=Chelonus insularis TaxID=460826 RepID=UPI00158E2322|nr:ionotropic receptor 25a-like isoform X2 [Chelonus insularis]